MKKKTAWIAGLTAGAGFLLEEMYRYIFYRHRLSFFSLFESNKGHRPAYYNFRNQSADRLIARPAEEYTIHSKRGEELHGFYYPCGSGGKKIAFIIHGYRSNHADTGGMFYDFYKNRGIDFFCCDHTAIGKSGGKFIGFDVLETQDCLLWVDFLREKFGKDVEIILHGFSMGAATVMQMSSHCPDNVKFIVEDSGYKNAYASLKHQIGPMYQPMRLLNRLIAGYDLDDSDVTESLSHSHIPMLFVHGQEDQLVPFENGPELYQMYPAEKDYFFPYATRHIESMYTSGEAYGRKLDEFIQKYLSHEEITE